MITKNEISEMVYHLSSLTQDVETLSEQLSTMYDVNKQLLLQNYRLTMQLNEMTGVDYTPTVH